MNKTRIQQEIIKVLVRSQFKYWVDAEPKTAQEMNSQIDRAISYYLGQSEKNIALTEQVRFHNLVEMQAAMIMRVLAEYE